MDLQSRSALDQIHTEFEFVKHLLNWHDGEVRFVGELWWMEVETNPVYDGMTCGLNHSRYWHAQTMRQEETRNWCFRNHGGGLPKGVTVERHIPQMGAREVDLGDGEHRDPLDEMLPSHWREA